ncbi:VWA domain-containing protein [Streptomyces sp. NPDC059835]|uniref:VWA domain-containing protein n=1 Tax=Streptomyces sp. NPDC059835 TaxID=3346967 RepID=UPI003652972F
MLKKIFSRTQAQTAPLPAPAGPAPAAAAPALRSSVADLTKKAAVSLTKHGLEHQKAAVYLVLDRSGSMRPFYEDGTVQYLAEQVLGLSRNLDDDGTVPVVFFSTGIDGTTEVSVSDYAGRIQAAHEQLGHMGRTYYDLAMDYVIKLHRASDAAAKGRPALVVFQSDGNPDNRPLTEDILRTASEEEDIFWAFVGYGTNVSFLTKLDHLKGRKVDNASHFHAPDPRNVAVEALYDGITGQFKTWLQATRGAGAPQH